MLELYPLALIRPRHSSTAGRHINGTSPRTNHIPSAEVVSGLPSGASGLASNAAARSTRLSPSPVTSSSMLISPMPGNVTNHYAQRNKESYCADLTTPPKIGCMTRGASSKVTKAFALRLAATRESAGYRTKAEFARALGVEPPTYRSWERGGAEPSIADLARIQEVTGVSLGFLIAGRVPVTASPPLFPDTYRRKANQG